MGGRFSVSAERASVLYLNDRATPAAAMPFYSIAPGLSAIAPNERLYCVLTWGIMSIIQAPYFFSVNGGVKQALDSSNAVGASLAFGLSMDGFVGETLTVWRTREESAAFFRSRAHASQMHHAGPMGIQFKVRRVWITGADLPAEGTSARKLWEGAKGGSFEAFEATQG